MKKEGKKNKDDVEINNAMNDSKLTDNYKLAWLVSLVAIVLLGGVIFAPGIENGAGDAGGQITGAFWLVGWLKGLIGEAYTICRECKYVETEKEGYYCNDKLVELTKCAKAYRRACFSCHDGFDKCEGSSDGVCMIITKWQARGEEICQGHIGDDGSAGVKKVKPMNSCPRE